MLLAQVVAHLALVLEAVVMVNMFMLELFSIWCKGILFNFSEIQILLIMILSKKQG